MQNNSLIKLLKTFTKKEIIELGEFLASPFFNKRQSVIKLFDELCRYYPEFTDENMTKENIFKILYPGKKYNDGSLRVLIHNLSDLTEEYLGYRRLKRDRIEFSMQLGKELLWRKDFKTLEKNILDAYKELDRADIGTEEYYFFKYRLEYLRLDYFYSSSAGLFEKIMKKADLENIFNQLTNFYIVKSMRMYLNILSIENMYKKNFKLDKLKEMIFKINVDDYSSVPVIQLYYYLIRIISEKDTDHFFYLAKKLLKEHKKEFNVDDLMGAYVNLNNYCTKKINEGVSKFENERFMIYKEELEEKTYKFSDDTMSPTFYRNVVTTGLILKEYHWVRNFIYEYKAELHKDYRENYFLFCLAHLEFHLKNYDTALELNSKIKFDELYIKLNSKVLQMQLFYETAGTESLMATIESFRHFLLNNNLIPESRKIYYTKFYQYLNKIILLKEKKDKIELSRLSSLLNKESAVSNKNWLLDKIKEQT